MQHTAAPAPTRAATPRSMQHTAAATPAPKPRSTRHTAHATHAATPRSTWHTCTHPHPGSMQHTAIPAPTRAACSSPTIMTIHFYISPFQAFKSSQVCRAGDPHLIGATGSNYEFVAPLLWACPSRTASARPHMGSAGAARDHERPIFLYQLITRIDHLINQRIPTHRRQPIRLLPA